MNSLATPLARTVGNCNDINDQHGVFLTAHEDGGYIVSDSAGATEYADDPTAALRLFADFCDGFAEPYTEAKTETEYPVKDAPHWAQVYRDAAHTARDDAAGYGRATG